MGNERLFNQGEQVRWVRAVSSPKYKNAVGAIIAVIPDDNNSPEFTIYDVQFSFGLMTLHGTQLDTWETESSQQTPTSTDPQQSA